MNAILTALQRAGAKRPYFDIRGDDGSLYMGRWWLFGGSAITEVGPRDDRSDECRGWQRGGLDGLIGQRFAARLHHIAREDRARDFHTHPFNFVSIVVDGWYRERTPASQSQDSSFDRHRYVETVRRPGSIAFRRASDRHTISEVSAGGCWTIFLMGRKQGSWGFHTEDGFVSWLEYDVRP